jgi:hypothetical protein
MKGGWIAIGAVCLVCRAAQVFAQSPVSIDSKAGAAKVDSARAESPKVDSTLEDLSPVLAGYLQPAFGVRVRDTEIPRDRVEVGALGSRVGIVVTPVGDGKGGTGSGTGTAAGGAWGYTLHLAFDLGRTQVAEAVSLVDADHDGSADSVFATRKSFIETLVEEASIRYRPASALTFKAGLLRVPFSVGHRSANFALMFPTRPGVNDVFVSGSDRGVLMTATLGPPYLTVAGGVFDGSSLVAGQPQRTRAETIRGPLFTARVDATPLGPLAPREADLERGPLRFGLGIGALYRPSTIYDATGYGAVSSRDFRVAASAVLAVRGLYIQGEILRRQLTDGLSSRPDGATGYYVQANYFARLTPGFGVAPLVRGGHTQTETYTRTRSAFLVEGGVSFFPRAMAAAVDSVRLSLLYQGEFRTTEATTAHGGTAQLQLLF